MRYSLILAILAILALAVVSGCSLVPGTAAPTPTVAPAAAATPYVAPIVVPAKPAETPAPAQPQTPQTSLKYDETGCIATNLASCRNPSQTEFVAVFVRNIQSGDKSLVDGIVAIQKLVAAAQVPSQDKWSALDADRVSATFVWCPRGDCGYVPDTAFPLMGIKSLATVEKTIAIVSAHRPSDPPATIVRVTCPAGDCWSFLLR